MKKISFLFALLCASVMLNAKQYCDEPLTLSGGAEIQLSCISPSAGTYQIIIKGTNLNGLGGSFYNPGAVDLRTKVTTSTSTLIVCDIEAESAPSLYTPLYVMCPGEQNINWPSDIEWGVCGAAKNDPKLTITSSASLTLDTEETSTITYTTLSDGAVTFTSSDTEVATVNASGVIKAVAAGTTTITVSQEGTATYNSASKKVKVTVSFAKKPSNQGYGSLRLIDADLYDWNGDFAGSNACGKVDLFIVTYGNKIVYKAVIKEDKAFEDKTDWKCQVRTWKTDLTGKQEHAAETSSEDNTTRYMLPTQTNRAPGLASYGDEMMLSSYMVITSCGARTIQTIPYTRDYINNYDSSDETAPVLGAATVTPGEDDVTISFEEITSEDVFYMIEDAAHNKKYCSLKPEFVLAKDGSGITYNYSCYAIDFNGNKSAAVSAEVNMPFSAVANQALNRDCEAGYEPNNAGEMSSKAIDGNEGTAWVTWADQPSSKEWINVDLGETYNISQIDIVWGDNFPSKYLVQTRTEAPSVEQKSDDTAWTNIVDTIEDATANSTKTINQTVVGRYVRLHACAKTSNCIRLKELRVFATSIYDPDAGEDTENPVITAASLVSKTYNSAVISITASDDKGIIKINAADASKSYSKDIETDGTSSITLTDLSEKTSYTITLTAYDAMNKTSEPFVLDAFTTDADPTVPQEVAPTPTHSSSNVLPVYSNAYDSVLAHSFGFSNWGSVPGTEKNIDGDHFVVYDMSAGNWIAWGTDGDGANAIVAKSGYHKESYTGLDASEMEFLHVDIWSQQAITNKYIIYINDQGLKTLRLSHSGEGWQSYNIDLDEFEVATDDVKKSGNVRWMKFDGFDTTTSKIAIDNVYFWKDNGTSTAIDNAAEAVKAQKVVENGQLIIIKNGIRYNVAGQKVQ